MDNTITREQFLHVRNAMTQHITQLEAFNAMTLFLKMYHEKTRSKRINALLGDMRIQPNGSTWSLVAWEVWTECIDEAHEEYSESVVR